MGPTEKAILGRKIGMTQVFTDDGRAIPVTVIEAGPCVVVQKKTVETDGYSAVQVAFGNVKAGKVNRPGRGHFKRWGVEPKRWLRELKLKNAAEFEAGHEIKADVFAPGDRVDVSGLSKGKGFAGVVKRWGFGRGSMTHGSKYHRGPGSLQARDASRVFKGRKLPGHMGNEKVTVQGLEVVRVDASRNLLLVRGAVPGPRGALVTVRTSVKAPQA